MKKILLLIFLGFTSGCSNQSEKVILFTDTDNHEIQSDYDYYLPNVIAYLDKKGIGHEKSTSRTINLGNQSEIKIEENEQFAMILISPEKDSEIEYRFGTDVDLILRIKEYFELE
ncbi:hypothetical protein OKW21_006737 [Catalinimonas alkaloidigena]|uniref:hypothetical protein n=1 Tax=Catalinimonas alkaloidigena TaxID=1075417 RepID=UPI002404D768|nr:hypothetical protein [Catalinimonas alkaloidigena]MDF9801428.1 hypothetical protein [Catalinimonas alkaloidigena]